MRIQVNAVHFSADQSLILFIQRKLSKLETFYDRILGGEVFLKLDKGDKKDTHIKQIEVKLNVPGNTIFVKESANSFEEALDMALEALTRKVKQFKEKLKLKGRESFNPIVDSSDDQDDDLS
ncbi:MAG: HPF/RaiA family ribosome-associated protein [Leadbetterella sp.]